MKGDRYAYFPGCSQKGTAVEYGISSRKVAEALGVELVEIEDWSCCGATPAHTVDRLLSGALAARNLATAEKMGLATLVTPCPACLVASKNALELAQDDESLKELNELLDLPFKAEIQAKSLLQIIFEEVGVDALAQKVKKPLKGMRLAPYYGCLLTRPPERAQFDDPENPISIDRILEALGAEVPDFPFKTECCGAAFGLPKRDMVLTLSGKILDMAQQIGADGIVLACSLCQQNLDLRQGQINSHLGTNFEIPIFYITQMIGLAFGFSSKEMGLDRHAVHPDKLLKKWEEKLKE
ncbi:MAG: CoB--CoM heterodisulfide reductase iron-sulfur subunit B family protein [Deltaproteobacteria bacterium]|nr:CoB--CoM heterodisulfide reductase iron-sulfur subunit B family protein [Deltaproteobacteria bacterium]